MAKNHRSTKAVVEAQPQTPAEAPAAEAGGDGYALAAERRAQLLAQADGLAEEDVLVFPGRSHERVRAAHRILTAATRDKADLVRAPFHDEPMLTAEEIEGQRDRIELFREVQSQYTAARAGQAAASAAFATLAAEAAGHKETLLRAFDLRFRNDPKGKKRVSAIRAGSGDADLVQDVSDIVVLCDEHASYLEKCPRGEAKSAKRLKQMSPELSRLLGAKTLTDEARSARRRRNAVYTLFMITERRIRAAAEYWYEGTDKMKEYAPYVAPAGAAPDAEDPPVEPVQAAANQAAAPEAQGEAKKGQ